MSTGPTFQTVFKVMERSAVDDEPRCEVCGEPVKGTHGQDWAVHHRLGRTGGSTDNTPANLLLVCGGSNVDRCHGRIHAHRGEAQTNGWSLSRNARPPLEPLTVPVLIRRDRWVYLSTDGQYQEASA